jgi:mRNA deadenylase 3'-5' endonuclease subunit Ccr4
MSFRVLSWNILAQQYLKVEEYKHLEEKEKDFLLIWPNRLKVILDILHKTKADIIFLQEVTLATFVEDFTPLFTNFNYIVHINNKHRRNTMGNAILFRKDMFTLIESHSRTKALHAKLSFSQSKDNINAVICLSNVHLTARIRAGESARMKEIVSATSIWLEEDNVIIGGDFNEEFQNPLGIATTLLQHGYKIPSYTEKDMSCCTATTVFRPDHILSKGNIIKVVELPMILPLLDFPIPTLDIPSDHLPIIQDLCLQKKLPPVLEVALCK